MKVEVIKLAEGEGWALVPKGKAGILSLEEAGDAEREINAALRAWERTQNMRDRTHMPPHVQEHPEANSWHWNEHPKGKFTR